MTRSIAHAVIGVVLMAGITSTAEANGKEWTTHGPAGHYVRDVAVDPLHAAVAYAATDGGVYKTTDGGQSWTAANSGLTSIGVYSVAVNAARSDGLRWDNRGRIQDHRWRRGVVRG